MVATLSDCMQLTDRRHGLSERRHGQKDKKANRLDKNQLGSANAGLALGKENHQCGENARLIERSESSSRSAQDPSLLGDGALRLRDAPAQLPEERSVESLPPELPSFLRLGSRNSPEFCQHTLNVLG